LRTLTNSEHSGPSSDSASLGEFPANAAAARSPARRLVAWHSATARFGATLLANLTLQDLAVVGLNTFLCWKATFDIGGPEARFVRLQLFGLLALVIVSVVCVRGELLKPGPLRASIYRVGTLGSMIGSYLTLRALLPALHPHLLDARLVAIDRALFGETPAVWLDAFTNRASVEWFAFFYYSYYWLLGGFLFGTLVFDDGRRRYELLLGAGLIAAVGHAGYTFVPGVGPWAYPELSFVHPLEGGRWWGRVLAAVTSAGAQLDIFPSLHTGFSLLCGLHALRYRRERPYRYLWFMTLFAVLNVIIATLFLRWHYGVDVVAGALLAFAAYRTAIATWRWEGRREIERGLQPVWEPVLPADLKGPDRLLVSGIFVIQVTMIGLLMTQCL
jgi:membrane-associated phospholipid phosphatase